MTSVYTAKSAIQAHGAAGAANADKRPRYHLRSGGLYLHWSGGFLTANREHAWSGTIDKARNCRAKFDAAAGCIAQPVSEAPALNREVAL